MKSICSFFVSAIVAVSFIGCQTTKNQCPASSKCHASSTCPVSKTCPPCKTCPATSKKTGAQ